MRFAASIQTKIIAVVSIVFILLCAGMYGFFSQYLLAQFWELEQTQVQRNIERVHDALKVDIDNINTKASDWALWDDAYAFIQDRDPDFITSNLQDQSLHNLKINVMVFIGDSGTIVYSQGHDIASNVPTNVSSTLFTRIATGSALLAFSNISDSKQGIIDLPEGLLMFAIRPIGTSAGTGPAKGALLFGRYLDDARVKYLSDVTHLSISMYSPAVTTAPSDVSSALGALSKTMNWTVAARGEDTVSGYTLISDIFSDPVLLLRIDMPRDIYKQGQESIRYLGLSLLGAGVSNFLIVLLLIRGIVVSRVMRLSRHVSAVGSGTGQLQRIPIDSGSDELSRLGADINAMLENLEKAKKQVTAEHEKGQRYIDIVDVMILVLDRNGNVALINPKGCEILGSAKEKIIGKNWFESFIPAHIRQPLQADFFTMLEGNNEVLAYKENAIVPIDNKERLIAWHNAVLRDEGGKINAVLCSGEDITDRRKQEKGLFERTRELERLNEILVGRELRMAELKKENEVLKKRLV